jgi:transglutaminase-like putative cysteine protease
MYYSIHHLTKFRYTVPVSESIFELRMQPRSEGAQHCLNFKLQVKPRTNVFSYRDYLGNIVHHFNVPGQHRQLIITAEALVDVQSPASIPESLGPNSWEDLAADIAGIDLWEMLTPSQFVHTTPALMEFSEELGLGIGTQDRDRDPLQTVLALNLALHAALAYVPKSTRVDSPIDDALNNRQGVCQDFAHIMLALARQRGIPARYVSGYLFHRNEDQSTGGATHAWVEVWMPRLGWIGIDPTNNVLAGERHVRTAVGRDYADVPPSRGVFKGDAEGELTVAVRVSLSDAPPPPETDLQEEDWSGVVDGPPGNENAAAQQQQQ